MASTVLRPASELVRAHVDTTIEALALSDSDAAAVKLARRYADAIDEAAQAQALADSALAGMDPGDIQPRAYVQALAARVETAALLEKLGPKLLDVLAALGATPAARSKISSGRPAGGPSKLAALRAAHGA